MSSTPSNCNDTNSDGNPDPYMWLTITADDSKLPVTWAGKTWVQSTTTPGENEAHSGDRIAVCPTSYDRIENSGTVSTTRKFRIRKHTWDNNKQLKLRRKYTYNSPTARTTSASIVQVNSLTIKEIKSSRGYYHQGHGEHGTFNTYNLGSNLKGDPLPTPSSWSIPVADWSTGSYTDSNNITYSWEPGEGW